MDLRHLIGVALLGLLACHCWHTAAMVIRGKRARR